MILTVEAPFDLGLTFGLDDDELSDSRILAAAREATKKHLSGSAALFTKPSIDRDYVSDEVKTVPYGVASPFGTGVRISMSQGLLIDRWKKDASDYWTDCRDILVDEFGEELYKLNLENLRNLTMRKIQLFMFASGAAYVRLLFDTSPEMRPDQARCFFRAYEFGGYGDFAHSSDGHSANQLLSRWRDDITASVRKFSKLGSLTQRPVKSGQIEIRGFQSVIFVVGERTRIDGFDGFFRRGDTREALDYDEGAQVDVTWYTIVCCSRTPVESNRSRLLFVVMNFFVAWEVCKIYEEVFIDRARIAIKGTLTPRQRGGFSREQLNRLKQFAALIITLTDMRRLSTYSGDIRLLEALERHGGIEKSRAGIASVASTVAQVEEDKIANDESRQGQELNLVLLVLTTLSLVGVASAVISAIKDADGILPDRLSLALALATPSLFIAFGLLFWRAIRK